MLFILLNKLLGYKIHLGLHQKIKYIFLLQHIKNKTIIFILIYILYHKILFYDILILFIYVNE
jgi:hypothetical protein